MQEQAPFFNLPFFTNFEPWMFALVFMVTFVGSLLVVPWVVMRLPADYFQHEKRLPPRWATHHPVYRLLLRVARNLLGVLLVLTGVTMLILPGQGLLTILIGVMLLEFPGKFQSERWLLKRKSIRRGVNWLRKKLHKPPFELD